MRRQVLFLRHAAGRVVRAVEEDRLGPRILGKETFDVCRIGSEIVGLFQIEPTRRERRVERCSADRWGNRG